MLSVNKLNSLVVVLLPLSLKAMKYFLILTFAFKVLSFPIPDERIIFPDELKELNEIFLDDFRANQMSLLNDPNILQSDNMTLEFLIDQEGFKNFEDGEYFQGDMVMLDEQLSTINDTSDMSHRTGIISEKIAMAKECRWKSYCSL